MVHARYLQSYPVLQHDRRESELCLSLSDPDACTRATWAAEAMAAKWSDGGPGADRVALLDPYNPRAVEDLSRHSAGGGKRSRRLISSFLMAFCYRFKATSDVTMREPPVEQRDSGVNQRGDCALEIETSQSPLSD
jgi:hypothetical protein